MKREDIQVRDPFIIVSGGKHCLFGTTDLDPWKARGVGFDAYTSADLEEWEGPYPAFRPKPDFWGAKNFWAPEAYAYRGAFYMFASFIAEGHRRGTQVLRSENVLGPYEPHSDGPLTPTDWECLDGSLHVDGAGAPWMTFCREWVQAVDGEILAVRLTEDLKKTIGEPILLFSASEAPWTATLHRRDGSGLKDARVTDGPFLHRLSDGGLIMLWSSISPKGYAMGIARSASGTIEGPWAQEERPLIDTDGGHGMAFRGLDGGLKVSFHRPNETPFERAVFVDVEESAGSLRIVG